MAVTSRAVHPFVGPVREELVFPDRHASLGRVHQIRARGEGRGPVTSVHDRQPARTMDHRQCHDVMTAADLLRYLFQHSTCVR